MALEELRGFGSFEQLDDRIAALPRDGLADAVLERAGFSPAAMRQAGDPLTALFVQVIERLELEFDPGLVHDVLTLLASARRGLSEPELRGLVSGQPAADDLPAVLRQLRPYLLSRGGLLGFFHGNLGEAVRKYYLDTDDAQRAAHIRLADFFEGQDDWLESLEAQRAGAAIPSDSPSRQWAQGGRAGLAAAPGAAVGSPGAHPHRPVVPRGQGRGRDDLRPAVGLRRGRPVLAFGARLFPHPAAARAVLRFEGSFLARHPTALFQCLWNLGWWYDSPEAARHYDPPPEGWPPEGPPWERSGPKLCALLEQWRSQKEERTPGFVWVRSLHPPAVPLGGAQLACLRGHKGGVASVAFDPQGRRIVSGSGDGTVRVWDADTGAELHCLRGHVGRGRERGLRPPGPAHRQRVEDGTVRVWDAATGAELHCLRGHRWSCGLESGHGSGAARSERGLRPPGPAHRQRVG